MMGILPIPWILVGELFPAQVRPILGGFVVCLAQCFIFICVKVYNDMKAYLNFSGTLATFGAASLLTILYCEIFLPETKNKSLEEIEDYFRGVKKEGLEGVDNVAFDTNPETFNSRKVSFRTVPFNADPEIINSRKISLRTVHVAT